MAIEIARIGIYGDLHLSSKNHGAHRDYPKESLDYLGKITEIAKKRNLTHLIGCGDLTFNRFTTLEYRLAVEKELTEQYNITNGNRYELKGNHDVAGYGITERDFYITKGLIKPSTNFSVGKLNITMVDYGNHLNSIDNIVDSEDNYNFIIAHDFFKFANTAVANFGKAIELDNFTKWFGADCIICGHVHKILDYSGFITKDNLAHKCDVHYLGCMTRPSYREGYMDDIGQVMVITVFDDGTIDIQNEIINLWPLDKSFNLEAKAEEYEKRTIKESRVDIGNVVKQLDAHDRNVGNPEDIIAALEGINEAYKNKAIEYLSKALA